MKQLVAAVFTLTAIVAGIVLATSLSSSAQEDGGDTTTTTVADGVERGDRFGFGLRFDGDLPPEIDEFLTCLREQDIEVPEDADKSYMFDLRSEDFDGLAEAIEECGLPGLGGRFAGRLPFDGEFPEGFPFNGELPEGFPFGGEGLEGFPFDGELPEGFPFNGEFPEGFPFDGEFPEGFPFGGELPEGFPFGGEGFEFHKGPMGLDRDELATCLAELDSFDSVDRVRERLDECLPAPVEFGELDGLEGFRGHRGHRGHGFPFGGHGFFDFDLEETTPELEDTSA